MLHDHERGPDFHAAARVQSWGHSLPILYKRVVWEVGMAALDIDSPYLLTENDIASFRTNGFVRLKHVLSPEVLAHYGDEITRKVFELNTLNLPMSERTTYQKAFLQIMNLWRHSDVVRQFVF